MAGESDVRGRRAGHLPVNPAPAPRPRPRGHRGPQSPRGHRSAGGRSRTPAGPAVTHQQSLGPDPVGYYTARKDTSRVGPPPHRVHDPDVHLGVRGASTRGRRGGMLAKPFSVGLFQHCIETVLGDPRARPPGMPVFISPVR